MLPRVPGGAGRPSMAGLHWIIDAMSGTNPLVNHERSKCPDARQSLPTYPAAK